MERKTEKKEQKAHNKRKLVASAAVTVVVLALVIGLSYAWFFNQSNIATLISISPPAPIAIKGPNGNSLTSLDLTYTDADKDENKKVTIKRVISIENGGQNHRIEIVHTTNLKGLTFKLYAATEDNSESGGSISEDGYSYTYDTNKPITGYYINEANTSSEYKSAVENTDTKSKHNQNYGDYEYVQKHAEPIYWITNTVLPVTQNGTSNNAVEGDSTEEGQTCLTYYVLEISWTETEKETDIFYVLAENE